MSEEAANCAAHDGEAGEVVCQTGMQGEKESYVRQSSCCHEPCCARYGPTKSLVHGFHGKIVAIARKTRGRL